MSHNRKHSPKLQTRKYLLMCHSNPPPPLSLVPCPPLLLPLSLVPYRPAPLARDFLFLALALCSVVYSGCVPPPQLQAVLPYVVTSLPVGNKRQLAAAVNCPSVCVLHTCKISDAAQDRRGRVTG